MFFAIYTHLRTSCNPLPPILKRANSHFTYWREGTVRSSNVSFLWRNAACTRPFRTGVCLHGHTMHSEECLSFLPRYLHRVPGVSQVVSRYQRGPRPAVDFSRAYWTPPLSPASALHLERQQITELDLHPLVSLTDHDNIEAGTTLQAAASADEVPISVEWTVPYSGSIFHLGIHNLPPDAVPSWMSAMMEYTATQDEGCLQDLLCALARIPQVLVVLNHPFWLEEGIEEAVHQPALDRFLRKHLSCIHAFELNGTRKWPENAAVMELARTHDRPVVSGGDRHACEPAACLNVTNSRTFSEFASEVKAGYSSVVFLPHYRQPMAFRILEASCEILKRYPEFPGRERWIDRVFYRTEDGTAQTLATLWKNREPLVVVPLSGTLQFLATAQMRTALRLLMSRQVESLP